MTKQQKLEKHLKAGKWINPDQARKLFGISASGYHSTLHALKVKNNWPEFVKKKVKTKDSYYLKHKLGVMA
jgi:hypothetical protein